MSNDLREKAAYGIGGTFEAIWMWLRLVLPFAALVWLGATFLGYWDSTPFQFVRALVRAGVAGLVRLLMG